MLPAPSLDQLKKYSELYHLKIENEGDLQCFKDFIGASTEAFNFVNEYPLEIDPFPYSAADSRRPTAEENPYNAWAWFCEIKGSDSGVLHGKTVAIKDNVAVPNVPMMNGSKTLEGFVPEYAATVVVRCLEQGATIKGKVTCEDLCLSGSSYNTTYGPVRNPWNPERAAGGSSSGSAVVVCSGAVDYAIGGDQGGSVRIPSSNCGIVGLKPTFGLVPYTGAMPIEMTLDHLGPMARDVEGVARLLEAVAGFDGNRDSRQPSNGIRVPSYTKSLENPTKPLKIGILSEGFATCREDVVQCVNGAIQLIEESHLFPVLEEISIPMHSQGLKIWNAVAVPGLLNQMVDGHGYGTGLGGFLPYTLTKKLEEGYKTNAHHLATSTKALVLLGAHVKHAGWSNFIYAKGQTLALKLQREYDRALQQFDVLLMPTLPHVAGPLPSSDASTHEKLAMCISMLDNTCPFNMTHHPAISLNAGYSKAEGRPLPVGLQLVGRRWDEETLLSAAWAVEKALASRQLPFPS